MKNVLIALVSGLVAAQAAEVQFDISPVGSDVATGLSPSNMVPAVPSNGSGGEFLSGVTFDLTTYTMSVALGYGSAAGFTDLTSLPTAMHIHGPAGAGTNAGVLIDLAPLQFPSPDPAKGGMISGLINYPTNLVADLLAGLHYITIHTVNNPDGEIRGQLIPLVASNQPPALVCPPAATVECGTPATLTAVVSDPDGDALTVVWSVNGTGMMTNVLAAGQPGLAANVEFTADLPLGTNSIGISVTDTATNSASCGTTVTVVDTTPPVIVRAKASPDVIWPPNHKMVYVHVRARVTDACSATTWKVVSVSSSESSNGNGDGNTSVDYQIVGDHAVKVRAERSGKGSGRTYTLTLQAQDASGNLSETKAITVIVPKSKGKPSRDDVDWDKEEVKPVKNDSSADKKASPPAKAAKPVKAGKK
jgi:hypothetical protein